MSGKTLRILVAIIVAACVLVVGAALIIQQSSVAWERQQQAWCLQNLRQIGFAMIQYAGEYNERHPSALKDEGEPAQRRFARLLKEYLTAPVVFHCRAASYGKSPDTRLLDGAELTKCSLESLADVYLNDDWCSYGTDPRANHDVPASRAILADRPDHRYWGTGVSSPEAGQPGSNSENHGGRAQGVSYNDGHVRWAKDCSDDSEIDPNIYGVNKEIGEANDSNIRFGTAAEKK